MGAGLDGIIFDVVDDNYKSNISKMVRFRDKVTKED